MRRSVGNEENERCLNYLPAINKTGIEMVWKHNLKSTREILRKSIFFGVFLPSKETALGPIWFGFNMNYHGLDPVSADKASKCPSCILILTMNIQQLAPISPLFSHLYECLTVLAIMCWRKMGKGNDIDTWSGRI